MSLVVGLAACGHIGFDAQPDSTTRDIVSSDGAPDAPTLRACPWTTSPTVGPIVQHSELGSGDIEADPQLVRGDPLTLHFSRIVPTGLQFDVYVAHRPAPGLGFDAPQPIAELATTADHELALQLDSSGHGYYVRGPVTGGKDLYEVQTDGGGVFHDVRVISELESGGDEYDPFSSTDGLSMWFTAGPGTAQVIYTASRTSTSQPWSNIAPFPLDGPGPDGGASLTGDGLLVVWASAPAQTTPSEIYFATRATTTSPWGPAQLLGPGTISIPSTHDLEPSIREDGCELFFSRSTGATDYNWEIYSTTLQ